MNISKMWNKLKQEQFFEKSFIGRLLRRIMFFVGFSQCRYCAYCKFDGDQYRGMRESILAQNGKCEWSKGMTSGNLNYEDLRKYHRCPGFIEMLFNFKGYAFSSEEVKRIFKSRWEAFVPIIGWIVAIIALFMNLYKK